MGCHKLINFTETYCDEHKHDPKERYKTYDNLRRNKKTAMFYNSDEWIKTREVIQNKFSHVDVYAYYVNKEIIPATLVHHIHEVKEQWDKRLNIDNLIPVSDMSHQIIHAAYKESKESKVKMQRLLIDLRNKWISELTLK
jgi:vacuolar-type H+-ATPase catalytic subunit A/Vma1